MELIFIVIAAVAPGVALLYSIYEKDKRCPEPIGQIARGFFYGVASAVFALVLELLPALLPTFVEIPIISQLFSAFIGAAIPEELAKLFMLWLLLRNNKYFDEHLDGIVYAISVAMGFASFENLLYLFSSDEWVSTGIARGLISVPGHYGFAVLMGYYYSLYHFQKESYSNKTKWLIFIAPVVAHGIFDTLLMVAQMAEELGFMIMILFFVFTNHLRKVGQSKIREMIGIDRNKFESDL